MGTATAGEPHLVQVGFGNVVAINRVLAVVSSDSAPIRRLVQEARSRGMVIDVTYGRKTKSVIVLDTGHLLLAAVQPNTIATRAHDSQGSQRGSR